jgi:hypothetical protein
MRATAKLVVGLTLLAASAYAGPLTFTFTSSLFNVPIGQTVTFSATLTNTGTTPLFLNGDSVSIAPPLQINDTKFFLNFPISLSAGQIFTAPILDVTAQSGAALGLHVGSMSILGGATPNELTSQASQTFAVNVVPEPGSVALLAAGMMVLGWVRRRYAGTGTRA